jgi:hypothetical protein
MSEDVRRHPDIFTPEEAAAYLRLDSERQLENLRENYGLVGFPGVGKSFRYWRDDLDAAAKRMFGRDKAWKPQQKMRMAE